MKGFHLLLKWLYSSQILGFLLEISCIYVTFFYGALHMEMPALADQIELTKISSVQTHDIVLKTYGSNG